MLHQHLALLADGSNVLGVDVVTIVIGLFLLGYVGLIVGAFISIVFADLNGGMKIVWLIFAFCAPFIGSLCWFLIGKKNLPTQAT